MRLQIADGDTQTRSRSLVGEPDAASYRIAVKRMDAGRGGSRHMWQRTTGDRPIVSEPHNDFPLSFDPDAYLLIAGGIGVTPLVSMALALAKHAPRGHSRVRVCYGARSAKELVYRGGLEAALGECFALFAQEANQRIDFDAEIALLSTKAPVYCCGPAPMLDAFKAAWQTARRPLQKPAL